MLDDGVSRGASSFAELKGESPSLFFLQPPLPSSYDSAKAPHNGLHRFHPSATFSTPVHRDPARTNRRRALKRDVVSRSILPACASFTEQASIMGIIEIKFNVCWRNVDIQFHFLFFF